jgi:hypothetical protein
LGVPPGNTHRIDKHDHRFAAATLIVRLKKKTDSKFWFTIQSSRPSLHFDFNFLRRTVSTQHSRKSFFAKFLGLLAAAGIAPKLLAKSPSPAAAPVSASAPFKLRTETRAVARSSDTV